MRKVVLTTIIAGAVALPSVASAKPIFLICTLTDRGGESVFDVQLNEEASSVSYGRL